MAQQFKEQGGAATMDPSAIKRWLLSRVITRIVSQERLQKQRIKTERKRQQAGLPHRVEYFHQVEDPYSHLMVQVLSQLVERYTIELSCHLVDGPKGNNIMDRDLLSGWSRYDVSLVASYYGLEFPVHADSPGKELVRKANALLAGLSSSDFIYLAQDVGNALWADDEYKLDSLAKQYGLATKKEMESKIEQGSALQKQRGHYSGAMLFYGEEWYWGVDRLYHLEERLTSIGVAKNPSNSFIAPRPAIDTSVLPSTINNKEITLEVFPSLRSPYTAIVFDRVLQYADEAGIKLVVRPVLPMVMRGVPVTRQKGFYIFKDTAREAVAENIPFGNFYDPIGEPVRRCYSLYPWACQQQKGNALISSFLKAAFVNGINTNTDRGLKKVVGNAGLDWQQAREIVGTDTGWEKMLEENRLEMLKQGLWGVPSFRLLNANNKQVLAVWGQDRLWLVAKKVEELIGQHLKASNAT